MSREAKTGHYASEMMMRAKAAVEDCPQENRQHIATKSAIGSMLS